MLIGNDPPEWATKLLDHWIEFDDKHHRIDNVRAFVYYADLLEPQQVRIFATPYHTALQEFQTGEVEVGSGIYATFIEEDKYTVLETPPELLEWTNRQVEENQKNDAIGAALCDKQE